MDDRELRGCAYAFAGERAEVGASSEIEIQTHFATTRVQRDALHDLAVRSADNERADIRRYVREVDSSTRWIRP